jgi:glutathione S-transferase
MLIIGSYLSPYVRKVLTVLHIKNIPYTIDPLVPFFGNENFEKGNVLRIIPIMIDEGTILTDSTVIIQYLEEKYPFPSILPKDLTSKAKHRMIEEYIDTFAARTILWGLWSEIIIKPSIFKLEKNNKRIDGLIEKDFQIVCQHLEKMLVDVEGTFSDDLLLAEISIASLFRNVALAGVKVDGKFVKLNQVLQKCNPKKEMKMLNNFEEISLKLHPLEHRKALKEMNAPISVDSIYWNEKPKLGPMSKL